MLDINKIKILDKSNMYDEIKNLFHQIEDSFEIIDNFHYSKSEEFNNIIICGMGGSAIGGDFVENVLNNSFNVSSSSKYFNIIKQAHRRCMSDTYHLIWFPFTTVWCSIYLKRITISNSF